MKSHWQQYVCLIAFTLGVPGLALAQSRDIDSGKEQEEAGLLLPAVQKAQSSEAPSSAPAPRRDVRAAPQRGIEPDEIDAANRATDQRRARQAAPAPRRAGNSASVRQMMRKLQPRQAGRVALSGGGGAAGPANVQSKPAEPPKYEIAECGTATSPMICCHHEQGDGSSCNLFKILCENAGGTAQGDGESAACSDW